MYVSTASHLLRLNDAQLTSRCSCIYIYPQAAVAYKYGIAGPVAYAFGATIQVFIFSIIATNFKLNAPFANTFLQVFRIRWGTLMHCVYIVFALLTNVLVSSMLILGGSATVTHLTGLNLYVSLFVTPLGVALYVTLGGLRASFIADYLHTTVLVAIILAFSFTVYVTSPKIGSFSRMKELLDMAPAVAGNAGGSYVTFRSSNSLIFGVVNLMGNCGALLLDQSYHQRAIASRATSATKGFILGGLAWTAVPLCIASSLGLAGRALSGQDPAMAVLTADEVSAGLAAPAAAAALLGKSGALMMLFLLFLAVTSASSAQLVAVSSVLTFDIFQPYIKPNATARQLFIVSHCGVVAWALVMAILGTIWHFVGISMGWLYTSMGIIVGPAVVPVFCATAWSKTNKMACLFATVTGLIFAITAWLVSAKYLEGEISIASTSANGPLLAANLIAVLYPAVIVVPCSLIWPENFDWETTRAFNAPVVSSEGSGTGTTTPAVEEEDIVKTKLARADSDEKQTQEDPDSLETNVVEYDRLSTLRRAGMDPKQLIQSRILSIRVALPLTFILLIFVPAMAVIPRTWTASGLGAWISIVMGWMLVSGVIVVLYPIYESRETLSKVFQGISRDLLGRSRQR